MKVAKDKVISVSYTLRVKGKEVEQVGADNPYRTTRTGDGISVEDRRSSEEAQQKIFAPDEGEYVEFTEE